MCVCIYIYKQQPFINTLFSVKFYKKKKTHWWTELVYRKVPNIIESEGSRIILYRRVTYRYKTIRGCRNSKIIMHTLSRFLLILVLLVASWYVTLRLMFWKNKWKISLGLFLLTKTNHIEALNILSFLDIRKYEFLWGLIIFFCLFQVSDYFWSFSQFNISK